MKYRTFFILALALLLPLGYACDNNNNSNAQDMDEPGTEMTDCPCFTKEDVLNMGKNSTEVICKNSIWGLLLILQGDDESEANAGCSSTSTDCTCGTGSLPNVSFTDISAQETGVCFEILINSLVQFGRDGGVFVNDCTFL
ncbi:MAG: hypothetical protein O7C70_05595 [Candidatus Dadabacteria bacterium]|jgi:hypothetical protein|nr:hypothetical protein [Candidatus Dadabacteria bacterium]